MKSLTSKISRQLSVPVSRAAVALLLLALNFFAISKVEAAPVFVPNIENLNLQGRIMPDVEFDHVGFQSAWQTAELQLWVAPVDRQTGNFDLSSALLLANNLAPAVDFTGGFATGNGPEWADAAGGSQIVYSIQAGPLGKENWRVGVAAKKDGVWTTGFAADPARLIGGAPEPSKLTDDPNPLTAYYYQGPGDLDLQLYWHSLSNPAEGMIMPFVNSGPGRWGKDNHLLVSTLKVDGLDQVVLFDAANPGTFTQITFDGIYEKTKPWIWQAPEFGTSVMMVLESSLTTPRDPFQIGLYRKINGTWTRFETVQPPPSTGFTILNSAEPFVYNNASYIFLAQIGNNPSQNGSKIWLCGIGPNKFYRQIAAPSDGVGSTDPEYLETEGGVLMYLGQRGGQQIYRAWTGIGPRSQNIPFGMAYIPAATFAMGDTFGDGSSDELPVHTVSNSAFFMDRYHVTSALWQTVSNWGSKHGYSFSSHVQKSPDYPVTVSWYEAARWCNARSEMEGRVPAYYTDSKQKTVYRSGNIDLKANTVKWQAGYRLPTEAEWENAARGGVAGHRFPWPDSNSISQEAADYYATSLYSYDVSQTPGYNPACTSAGLPYTALITSFAANPYGLHSMAGNLWQWCWDWYDAKAYATAKPTDPLGSTSGTRRVIRGGSWASNAYNCRVSRRGDPTVQTQKNVIGFRTVLPE